MFSGKNLVLDLNSYLVSINLGGNVLFSFAFMLFKLTNIAAINFSIIIGILSILLFFYFVYLFYNEKIALWAALFMAVSQPFIINSISTYNHGMALFPVFLSLIFFGLFIKSNNLKFNFTSLLILTFAISMRQEYILILLMYITYYIFLFIKKRKIRNGYAYFRKIIYSLIAIIIFLIPFFYLVFAKIDLFLININPVTNYLTIDYFSKNLINMQPYINGFLFIEYFKFTIILKIIFLILLLVGLVYSFLKNKYLTINLFLYVIIFHFFFSFMNTTASRFLLSSMIIIFIFLSCALFFIIHFLIDFIKIKFLNLFIKSFLIIAVACFILYPIIALSMSRSNLDIGQQKLILQTRLPSYISNFYSNEINNCTFVSAQSTIYYATSDLNVLTVNEFKSKISEINLSSDCFIFIKDILCHYPDEYFKCDYMFENFLLVKDNDFYLGESKEVFFTTYKIKELKN